MALNFPASPTNGQKYNGFTFDSSVPAWKSDRLVGTPAGVILSYAGTSAPTGYLLADGTTYNRSDYPDLFAALGGASSPYGLPSGTTFKVPDLRTRVPVGKNGSGTFGTLGSVGGAETVALSEANLPSHTHSINHDHASFTSGNDSPDHSHSTTWAYGAVHNPNGGYAIGAATTVYWYAGFSSGGASTRHQHSVDVPAFTGTSGATGSGTAHANLQPYITVNYIIKY